MLKATLKQWLTAPTAAQKPTTRGIGQQTEQAAKAYLTKQGLQFHTQNYHCRHGEIDLIMQHQDCWVFVEVRYRNSLQFGGGVESVDSRKQQKIIRCAEYFMQHHEACFNCCRFDVIAMSGPLKHAKIEWLQDAFIC